MKRILCSILSILLLINSLPDYSFGAETSTFSAYTGVQASIDKGQVVSCEETNIPSEYFDKYTDVYAINVILNSLMDNSSFDVTLKPRRTKEISPYGTFPMFSLLGYSKDEIDLNANIGNLDDDEDTPIVVVPGADDDDEDTPIAVVPGADDDDEDTPIAVVPGADDDDEDTPIAVVPGADDDDEDTPIVVVPGADDDDEDTPIAVVPGADDDDEDTPIAVVPGADDDDEDTPIAVVPGADDDDEDTPIAVVPGADDDDEDTPIAVVPGADDDDEDELIAIAPTVCIPLEKLRNILDDNSAHNKVFHVNLNDGKGQLIVFYYNDNVWRKLGNNTKTPIPIIMNFYTESAYADLVKLINITADGNFENVNDLYEKKETFLVVPKGTTKVDTSLQFNTSDIKVELNGETQLFIPDENGKINLSLNASQNTNLGMSDESINRIAVYKDNNVINEYKIYVINQRFDDLPDSVSDYLCIGSQYTNGLGLSDYGLRPVRSLVGSNLSAGGVASGPVSLGNFGGYITYYYEDPITDNPNNPFGIDFIVYGNAYIGSQEFGEPGQVWVSSDGVSWYALAGGMHYEDYSLWNYNITYKKTESGATESISKNGATSLDYYQYPLALYYPYHHFKEGDENQISLNGILFDTSNEKETDDSGSTMARSAGFGYADLGSLGTKLLTEDASSWLDDNGLLTNEGYDKLARNIARNPYVVGVTSTYPSHFDAPTDGMDLAWAVDDKGNPVSLENGVHYIKIVTASNINNGGIGEKSTEVNMVRVARANEAPVGISTAPESISFDGNTIDLDTGTEISRNVYLFNDVKVSGPFIVDVDAENSNVYINNTAKSSVVYDKIPDHKIVRVIVQEGEKEPLIYVFNLVEGEEETNAVLTLDANGGKVNGNDTYAMTFDAGMAGYELPEPTNTDASVEFAGWYYGQRLYTEIPSDVRDITLTAKWESAESDDPSGNTDDTIRVSFRLIGSTIASEDVDLSKGEEGYYTAEYQNWIKTRTYTMHSDDSVYDLFVKATSDAGIESEGANKGYVSAIKAPDSLGGYWLKEFTNGKYSGWMYTMDGKHTNAIKDQKLKDGAVVIFHYVNDYRYEVKDWFDEPAYPAAATDGEFYNRWLEAADVRPGSQGGTTPVDPAAEQPVETPENPGGAADRFTDVEANDWFAGSVDYAVEKGFMTGTGADTFSPDKELTRGMLVSMLYSLEGVPAEDGKTAFGDVKTADWFAKGVDWAVENGVAAGYGENFGPNDDITREQMVVMLYGYAKLKGYTLAEGADLSAYKDVDEISAWALEAVRWAKGANLITGRSADLLAPKGTTTRAEAATILRNFLENVAK